LLGRPEGKVPLRKTRSRWEDNIRMDLREISGKLWTGSMWLRIDISGGLLSTRY
jgi:hypothetical protein